MAVMYEAKTAISVHITTVVRRGEVLSKEDLATRLIDAGVAEGTELQAIEGMIAHGTLVPQGAESPAPEPETADEPAEAPEPETADEPETVDGLAEAPKKRRGRPRAKKQE